MLEFIFLEGCIMLNKSLFSSEKETWETPIDLFNFFFVFTLYKLLLH